MSRLDPSCYDPRPNSRLCADCKTMIYRGYARCLSCAQKRASRKELPTCPPKN